MVYNTEESNKRKTVVVELGSRTILALLQIPLICLKLVNLLPYPWVIVLSPSWGIFAIALIFMIINVIMWWVQNTFFFSKK